MDGFERRSSGPRVHFLIGSGVACAANVLSTKEMTDKLLGSTGEGEANAPQVRFLGLLKSEVDSIFLNMFGDTRLTNYEDLYYVASQIGVDFWEYENPAIVDFVERVVKDEAFVQLAAKEYPDDRLVGNVGWLANDTVTFIQRQVQRLLEEGSAKAELEPLGSLLAAAKDPLVGSVDIFSLNHDLLLERLFREAMIPFDDGLAVHDGDLSFWSLEEMEQSRSKIQLVKLHGSIDWWQFGTRVGKAEPGPYNPHHLKDHAGREFPPGEGPVILIGTFNKMLKQASEGIFLDLLGLYSRRLHDARHLVIAGYGFGDKGINSVLATWLDDRRGQAVWIHPHPLAALEGARGAMSREGALGRAISRGVVAVIPRSFGEVTWDEVKKNLTLTPLERHRLAVDLDSLESGPPGTTYSAANRRPGP